MSNYYQTEVGKPEYSSTDAFLWWLSTAEPELIKDCTADRNRYRITGLIVLGTWLFATLAWTYFFSTTLNNAWAYLPMGIFMGFIILTIDRALIKGINKANKNKLGPLAFRGLLAVTIGLFMAQPAVLYLFDKEVKMQASLDNEARRQAKRQQLDSLYAGQKQEMIAQKATLESGIRKQYDDVLLAQKNFLAETDGTGGSGKVGISTIALAKKAEYEKLNQLFVQNKAFVQPQIDSLNRQLALLEENIRNQEQQFAQLLNNGFLTRIEALQNLVTANKAVAFRYYLIVAILMLIELMPVIAKSLLPSGPYEEKLRLTELMEKEDALASVEQASQLKKYFREAASSSDRAMVDAFFKMSEQGRESENKALIKGWAEDGNQSFRQLWQRVKRRIIAA